MKWMQRSIVALLVVGVLSLGLAGQVAAQEQDGLVNVVVGDVTVLENVAIADAVNLVVQVCDVNAVVSVLARVVAVDRNDQEQRFCTTEEGDVTVTQN
jgi:hypothetical protein